MTGKGDKQKGGFNSSKSYVLFIKLDGFSPKLGKAKTFETTTYLSFVQRLKNPLSWEWEFPYTSHAYSLGACFRYLISWVLLY